MIEIAAYHDGVELTHLARMEWVDGLGDVADSCSAEWLGDPLPTVEAPPDGHVTLSVDGEQLGPYDVLSAGISGEEMRRRLSGAVAHHFEAEVADRDDESSIYGAIIDAVASYAARTPWTDWIATRQSALFMRQSVAAELFRADSLAATRQILAKWGLTVIPTMSGSGTSISYGVEVRPLFPLLRGIDIPLDAAYLSAAREIEMADGANAPGRFRDRRIVGMHRRLGVIEDDPILVESGATKPALYLAPTGNLLSMELAVHVERWRLQNSSMSCRIVYYRYDPAIVPQRIITLPADYTGDEADTAWHIESIHHRWDADQGYRAEIAAALWQGPPITVAARRTQIGGAP